ncbi:flagellar export protein FliJ [Reinekea thalattae]|uniref:Flagellar FliJ protein n=1 Tax=Reinekea thalattae TaxID=2593301 RepID=A0A5C8Z978_9GAMM|nr:flagellar export protein FliJ [Reinekea thalattae]TXR53406.1 flagellar export protein FliJ [Reinekea thalattae]
MSRSKRLQLVAKLAQQREDQAVQALAEVRSQLALEQQRLDELLQYRKEYQTYLDQQANGGIAIEQWRRTQGFIDQLAMLAQRQESTIASWQQREQQVLEKWRELYQKKKNIGQFIDKVSAEELIAEDKKEQKFIDELVTQRFHRS